MPQQSRAGSAWHRRGHWRSVSRARLSGAPGRVQGQEEQPGLCSLGSTLGNTTQRRAPGWHTPHCCSCLLPVRVHLRAPSQGTLGEAEAGEVCCGPVLREACFSTLPVPRTYWTLYKTTDAWDPPQSCWFLVLGGGIEGPGFLKAPWEIFWCDEVQDP